MKRIILCALALSLVVSACGESEDANNAVVIYTSVDQNFAEPILRRFETETGIEVKAVYDVEAAKTTGLVKRLAAEASNPQADLFWSGEPVQTQVLADQAIFMSHVPSNAREGLQSGPDNLWTAFGGRARVLIVNRQKLEEADWPKSIYDFLASQRDLTRAAIAYPLFGTSSTHAAALFSLLGPDKARAFYDGIVEKNVAVVDGNSVVRDLVVAGKMDFGLTDTDDACSAIERMPETVAAVFPDQGPNDMGTLVIPNTIARVKNGPNSETAEKLYDFLVSEEVADLLAAAGWFGIDGTRVFISETCNLPETVKPMVVDYAGLSRNMDDVIRDLRDRIVR